MKNSPVTIVSYRFHQSLNTVAFIQISMDVTEWDCLVHLNSLKFCSLGSVSLGKHMRGKWGTCSVREESEEFTASSSATGNTVLLEELHNNICLCIYLQTGFSIKIQFEKSDTKCLYTSGFPFLSNGLFLFLHIWERSPRTNALLLPSARSLE